MPSAPGASSSSSSSTQDKERREKRNKEEEVAKKRKEYKSKVDASTIEHVIDPDELENEFGKDGLWRPTWGNVEFVSISINTILSLLECN